MISLIIPAYNEGKIIKNTIEQVLGYFAQQGLSFELILIDDASTDQTLQMMKAYQSDQVIVLENAENRGKGYCMRRGVMISRGDILILTDADCAYGLEPIGRVLEAFEKMGVGAVIGSRKMDPDGYNGYSLKRRVMSFAFSYIVNRTLHLQISDSQCGLKAFKSSRVKELFSMCKVDGFGIDFEILTLCRKYGIEILQIPVRMGKNNGDSSIRPVRDSFAMLCEIAKVKKQHGG